MFRYNISLLLIISFFITLSGCGELSERVSLEKEIDTMIPEAINDTTPGMIVGVMKDGEIIFQKGYGLANLNYDLPNNPELVYNIGSVTKQFLGYAFAMQHVAGTLSIDDPVSDYLEDWPEFDQAVTIRNLLNHSSGYREAYTMSTLAGRQIGVDRLSQEEALEVVRRQPELEFSPDSRYTYNSTAWVILAEIFEEATGESAAEWVDANILDALDMNGTQIETYVGQPIEDAAESYSYSEDQGYINEKSNRAIFGAADIFMNVPDAMKWISNMKTGELGGQEVLNIFLEPNELSNGINSGYALGIGVGEYRGLRRYRHTGGHAAFGTQLSYYPDQDVGIFIVSNFGGVGLSSQDIAELVLSDYMEPEVNYEDQRIETDPELMSELPGRYINEDRNDYIDLSTNDGKIVTDNSTELIPVLEREFRINGIDAAINFSAGDNGNMNMSIRNNEGLRNYMKMEVWNPVASDLQRYTGTYMNGETDSIMHFDVNGDGMLEVSHRWLGAIPIKPLARDIFEAGNGMMVEFTRNNNGAVNGFYVNTGRTLNVWFEKE